MVNQSNELIMRHIGSISHVGRWTRGFLWLVWLEFSFNWARYSYLPTVLLFMRIRFCLTIQTRAFVGIGTFFISRNNRHFPRRPEVCVVKIGARIFLLVMGVSYLTTLWRSTKIYGSSNSMLKRTNI